MILSNKHIAIAGWVIIALCLLGATGYIDADRADELTTAMVMLLLAYFARMGVFYFAAALAIGKVWDGASVWPLAEFIWDGGATLLLIYHYYKQWEKKKSQPQ